MDDSNIHHYIAFLLFINGLVYLTHFKIRRHLYLGLFIISIGYLSFYEGLFVSDTMTLYPEFYGTYSLVSSFAMLSCLLFCTTYFKIVLDRRWVTLMFIAPVLQLASLFPYFSLPRDEKIRYITETIDIYGPMELPQAAFYISFVMIPLMYATYLYLAIRGIRWHGLWIDLVTNRNLKSLTFFVLSWIVLQFVIDFTSQFVFAWKREYGSIVSIVARTDFLFLINFIQMWPTLHKLGILNYDPNGSGISAHTRSYLDGVDLDGLRNRFESIVLDSKIYTSEEFSLGECSRLLNLSLHQTSEFFNRHLRMSFSLWLNTMRIREAKRLLNGMDDLSLVEVCYRVGYNSSSAFYRACKKIEKVTPAQLRNNVYGSGVKNDSQTV